MLAPKRACMHVCIRFFSASSISKQTTKARNSVIYSNTLITKHGKNGDIKAAESVFNRMPCKNIISWTAMLTAYAANGLIKKARKVFDEMPERSVASWNAILSGYIRNRVGVDETLKIFLEMPERNAVSYGVMLNGLVQAGRFDKAEKLYNEVPLSLRDPVSSNVLISGYVKMGKLEEAVRVFEGMGERNVVSWSSMLDGYCKEGKISEARELFSKMPERNVITWTCMIHGYLKMGCFEDGFRFFLRLRHEDSVVVSSNTMTILFEACGRLGRYVEACQLHALVLQMGLVLDVFLRNTVITMYCRFGCIDAAANIFHMIDKKDTVSWNSIIAGYVQSGDVDQAFELFKKMPEKDVVSWTTMIKGFSSNGSIEKSIELFEMMPDQGDDVAWTAVISGLENNGEYEKAICWFMTMLRRDVRPNPLTFSSVLSSSASLAILNQGQQLHAHVLKMNVEYDLSIQNSLVSMYSKCGSLGDAYRIFESISDPNVVSFNSMLTGFSQNGYGNEALSLFKEMEEKCLNPNEITFLGVLSACTHVGLVEEGWHHFRSMKCSYNIEPGPDHYACMVDLLGRAGLLNEAIKLINRMPVEPHSGVWGALLAASKTFLRVDIAKVAAQHLSDLEPSNATPYVVLSDLYSIAGEKEDEEQVRIVKKMKGIKKSPGCSWIIVKDKIVLFLSGDQSHVEFADIKGSLRLILDEMKQKEF
ncbi:pentatricopeptide repeat-containing protein, mitochondrial [Heracleum sosnowskyi]|uniref:Pentatricopeptide repeat-containing protein, mitochondrial n=1 Tax=Heracleum sosnowskyi TaxID=360622 RepID=A0AAD8IQ80_9APIA|nr:pentatricopeptide repeat-containing protein, mitochondrial [Heracleum sosnowskyi]